MTERAPSAPLTQVRTLLAAATGRLLGDTIGFSDEDWAAPSALPDWTRGHVGAHIARNADAIGRLARGAATGEPGEMYPDGRDTEIERDAHRNGMEQQIDLDTTAQELSAAFDAVDRADAWSAKVTMRSGSAYPASYLPLARLAEVVLHHIDLDCGYTADRIPDETALWLLQLCARRLAAREDIVPLRIQPGDDEPVDIGTGPGDRTIVSGPAGALVGWLTNRGGAAALSGTEGLTAPGFG